MYENAFCSWWTQVVRLTPPWTVLNASERKTNLVHRIHSFLIGYANVYVAQTAETILLEKVGEVFYSITLSSVCNSLAFIEFFEQIYLARTLKV